MATQQHTTASFVPLSSPSLHNSVYQNGVQQQEQQGVDKSTMPGGAGSSQAAVDATVGDQSIKMRWSEEQHRQTTSLETYINGAGSLPEQRRQQQHLTSGGAPAVANYYQQNFSWSSSLPASQQPQNRQQQPQPQRQQVDHHQQQQGYNQQQPQQHHAHSFEPPQEQQQQHQHQWGNAYSSSAAGGLYTGLGSQMHRVRHGGVAGGAAGPVAAAAPVAAAGAAPVVATASAPVASSSSSSFSVAGAPGGAAVVRHVSAVATGRSAGVSVAGEAASGVYFRRSSSSAGAAAPAAAPGSPSTSNVWQSPFGAATGGQASSSSLPRGNLVSSNSSMYSSQMIPSGIAHPAGGTEPGGAAPDGGYLQQREGRGVTAAKMSFFTATAGAASAGAAAAGGGGADVQRVVVEAMLSSVRDNLSSEAAERVSQLQKWFPSLISTLRPYFCVTQTSVRKRLLQLLFPYSALLPARGKRRSHHGSSFDNLHSSGSADCSGADYSSGSIHHGGGSSSSSTSAAAAGGGATVGSAFARDLYTPSMALITYVLLYALSRADDFQPELLGSTMSLALLLLAAEVLVAKLALYCVGAPGVYTLDLFSFCGYKYVNLVIILLFRLLVEALNSADAQLSSSSLSFPSSFGAPAAVGGVVGSSNSIGSDERAGIAAAGAAGVVAATGNAAQGVALEGGGARHISVADAAAAGAKQPAMRALALLSSVPPSILEKNTWLYAIQAVYVYMCVCAAAEVVVLLRAATAAANEKAAAAWGGSSSRSSRAQQYVYGGLALAQIPLCWLLMPSFAKNKKV